MPFASPELFSLRPMIVFDPAPAVVKNFDGVISYTPLPTGFEYHVPQRTWRESHDEKPLIRRGMLTVNAKPLNPLIFCDSARTK